MLQRVVATEAALQSGQFEAMIDYGNGSKSFAQVQFDLGDKYHVPRLSIITTYESAQRRQTRERITIGDKSWQRRPGGDWDTAVDKEGAWGQVQTFLPHTDSIERAETDGTNKAILRWYDSDRDADVALRIDPNTGAPLELRQVTRTTKTLLVVTYTGWNTKVDIAPPNRA